MHETETTAQTEYPACSVDLNLAEHVWEALCKEINASVDRRGVGD